MCDFAHAETILRLGQTAQAIADINTVRARVFNPPKPIAPAGQQAVRDAILQERLFELTGEAKRRQDLIRLGGWTRPWLFKAASSQTQLYRVLMPISQTQLGTNPKLTQNPGY